MGSPWSLPTETQSKMFHHLIIYKSSSRCPLQNKHSDTNRHLVVEPDVHEEAVHVGPEQRRADQMRHTLEEKPAQRQEWYNKSLAQIS